METKLERISQLSKENPEMVFTSIGHLIDKELLKDCHKKMDGKKKQGVVLMPEQPLFPIIEKQ